MDSTKTGRALPEVDGNGESNVLLDNYLNSVRELFARALALGGKPIKKYFTLCGSAIELIFPDDRLLPYIIPALEHLSIAAAQSPALTIRVWDDVTTDTIMPDPPWSGCAVMISRFHAVLTALRSAPTARPSA